MATATPYVYCTPKDVKDFLLTELSIDANSTPSDGVIAGYIRDAEGEFEDRTGTAFKPVFVQDEVHDLQAWRNRYREQFSDAWFAVPRPIQLRHRPLLPFDKSRGHRIEVYEGNFGTVDDAHPEGQWTEFLDKTHGRENQRWSDLQAGKLFIKKTFLFRRADLVRVSYEYGKPITTLSSNVAKDDTTINVDSTWRYQTRGYIRIGDEWIFHTGKTDTSFTGCQRAQMSTRAKSYNSGSEVYEVPDNIRRITRMKAASLWLQNDRERVAISDGGDRVPSTQITDRWDQKWEKEVSSTYQRWGLL